MSLAFHLRLSNGYKLESEFLYICKLKLSRDDCVLNLEETIVSNDYTLGFAETF